MVQNTVLEGNFIITYLKYSPFIFRSGDKITSIDAELNLENTVSENKINLMIV
jgi:hypothetical protein